MSRHPNPIVVPPRNPLTFVNNTIAALKEHEEWITNFKERIKSMRTEALNDILHDAYAGFDKDDLLHIFRTDVPRNLSYAQEDLQLAKTVKGYDLAKIIRYAKENIARVYAEIKFIYADKILENSDEIYRAWIDYNEYAESSEFIAPEEDLILLLDELPKRLRELQFYLSKLESDLQALLLSFAGKISDPDPVEILFHASVNARDLYRDGFSIFGPSIAAGIGQFGGVLKKTSFTASEETAEDIAVALLGAVLIARGEIRQEDIWRLAEEKGITDTLKDWAKSFGVDTNSDLEDWQVMDLYRYYLAIVESSGGRENPLFVGSMDTLMDRLRNVDPSDVGYVACSVDMTDPDIEYLHSLFEFRIPPKSILKTEWFVPVDAEEI